jgi:protein gp37
MGVKWGPGAERRVTSTSNWKQLRRWDRKAKRDGVRRRVFVASLADVFDSEAPIDGQWRLWAEIESCPNLEFLLLTKRPENWVTMLPANWLTYWPAHVRLGFTAEDQERWESRCRTAFRFRCMVGRTAGTIPPFFVSCEPLIGGVDLRKVEMPGMPELIPNSCTLDALSVRIDGAPLIGWVIAGGESGKDARPMQAAWARSLRDQCQEYGTPFMFKQWGAWVPTTDPNIAAARGIPLETCMSYVGKEAAGHVLDGREWMEFPQ